MSVWVDLKGERRNVPSLAPYLRRSLELGQVMDAALMAEKDASACRWLGYGVGKGVTSPSRRITAFGIPECLRSALHGDLIQPFGNVDRSPRCYERDSRLGFGGFVRWVYFADPADELSVVGVDWCAHEAPHIGVVTRAADIPALAAAFLAHGIPGETRLALIGPNMCESGADHAWRIESGLATVNDWVFAENLFGAKGRRCPKCGQRLLADRTHLFCHNCGTRRPDRQNEGGQDGLEMLLA